MRQLPFKRIVFIFHASFLFDSFPFLQRRCILPNSFMYCTGCHHRNWYENMHECEPNFHEISRIKSLEMLQKLLACFANGSDQKFNSNSFRYANLDRQKFPYLLYSRLSRYTWVCAMCIFACTLCTMYIDFRLLSVDCRSGAALRLHSDKSSFIIIFYIRLLYGFLLLRWVFSPMIISDEFQPLRVRACVLKNHIDICMCAYFHFNRSK